MLQGRGACLPRGVCFHPSGTALFYTEMLTSRSGAEPVSYTLPQAGESGLVHQDLTPGVVLPQLAWRVQSLVGTHTPPPPKRQGHLS